MQLVAGRIGRAHGVRGEVAVEVRTDEPDRRFAEGAVLSTDPSARGPLTVVATRWHQGRLLVRFTGIEDRTQAETLRGTTLVVDVDEAERLADPDEFYDHQLIGLNAVTTDGQPVGTVTDVLHLPAQDLLAIERSDGVEVLVPFVAELVPSIDIEANVVSVVARRGLLDPETLDESSS
ncbi:MAG: ribosome maturation factor RimM [Acidothermaceae bacterium]